MAHILFEYVSIFIIFRFIKQVTVIALYAWYMHTYALHIYIYYTYNAAITRPWSPLFKYRPVPGLKFVLVHTLVQEDKKIFWQIFLFKHKKKFCSNKTQKTDPFFVLGTTKQRRKFLFKQKRKFTPKKTKQNFTQKNKTKNFEKNEKKFLKKTKTGYPFFVSKWPKWPKP